MYASSSAIYNASDPSPAPETGGTSPSTLYGVSKLADEGIARVYRADAGVSSIGLRPYVVYGVGRDQGMTSSPTAAMLAAARGEASHIGFSGVAQYDYAPDVARAAVTAAHSSAGGAAVYNTPGAVADVADVVAAIRECVPEAEITWSGDPLPFPAEMEAVGFDRDVGPFPRTPLAAGVAATIERVPAGSSPDDRLKPGAAVSGLGRSRRPPRRMPARQRQQHEELPHQERRGEPEDGVEGSRRIPHGAEVERRGGPDRVAEAEHHRDEGADPGRRSLEVERQRHHHREQATLRDAGEEGARVGEARRRPRA